MLLRRSHILLTRLLLLTALLAPPAAAEEADEVSHSLGLTDSDAAGTFRFARPASHIAENVTVVTADDIARINAHTLADVLQTVPGVQLTEMQTPGTFTFFSIAGASNRHIQLLIDGVPQNFLSSDNVTNPGIIPAQMIERVEIVKGPASSPWSASLGGMVSVITKSPSGDSPLSGLASVSVGEASTVDGRGEISGTSHGVGYYVSGGKLRSDGLLPGNGTDFNHAFGKILYDLPRGGNVTLGLDVRDAKMGSGYLPLVDLNCTGDLQYLNGYLALRQPLPERLTLELQGMGGKRSTSSRFRTISSDFLVWDASVWETYRGIRAGLLWGDAQKNLSAGVEYQHDGVNQRENARRQAMANFSHSLDRSSAYLNGTYTIGRLSLLPGVRYEKNSILEDALSYTLGATVRLGEDTVLRAYASRGYSLPVIDEISILNGVRQLQNIWTAQGGIESSALPYLWFKGTVFYNNIWKIQDFRGVSGGVTITLREQVRQGLDLELSTYPLYGFSLAGGYNYTQSWDKDTKKELAASDVGPRQLAKLALRYDNNPLGLKGALTGNYTYWHDPEAKNSAVLWDLHLNWKIFPAQDAAPELFFSVHNILNGAQYLQTLYPNPSRWFEVGVRYRF